MYAFKYANIFYNKKVITKSSIESELAGVADHLSKALFLRMFTEMHFFVDFQHDITRKPIGKKQCAYASSKPRNIKNLGNTLVLSKSAI